MQHVYSVALVSPLGVVYPMLLETYETLLLAWDVVEMLLLTDSV